MFNEGRRKDPLKEDWRQMNYEEARVYLDNVAKYGSVLGLDAMRELLKRLGNPETEDHSHRGNQRKRFRSGFPFHGADRERISGRTLYLTDAVFLPGEDPGGWSIHRERAAGKTGHEDP